jgi:hypothetical protein
MGLMEDLGAWLDQKRRNVASSVQNPGLLYTRMNEDARQFQQDQRANWGDIKSVVPEVKAAGIKEFNASGQELGGLLGAIKVFHGSPHKFDRFDFSKIGTGEGAQAYGRGGYVSEAEKVGESYRHGLSDWYPEGETPQPGSIKDRAAAWVAEAIDSGVEHPIPTAIQKIKRLETDPKTQDALLNQIGEWVNGGAKWNRGYLYEANLRWPDPAREAADPLGPQHFLDLDKPIKDQPAALKIIRDSIPEPIRKSFDYNAERGITGENAAKNWVFPDAQAKGAINPDVGGAQEYYLSQRGIPGFRYLDGSSRSTTGGEILDVFQSPEGWRAKIKVSNRSGAGGGLPTDHFTTSMPFKSQKEASDWAASKVNSGTRNYVVFDDALTEILKRNGQPLGLLGP